MEPSELLTRRRLFAAGGAGLALVALGGAGLALQGTVTRAPRTPLQALSTSGFSILAAAAERICPAVDGLPSPWDLQVPESIDLFLASSAPGVTADLEQGLWFLENALPGLLFEGRVRPFTALDPTAQDRSLVALRESGLGVRRTVYKGLVSLVSATYWGDARAHVFTGYVPLSL